MYSAIIIVFVVGYIAIAFENALRINKTATALLTGVLCWVVYVMSAENTNEVSQHFYKHIGEISGILFFLLGAMTVVEIIDAHDGFEVITSRITTNNSHLLLWIVGFVSFFLSSALDNLTTTIVMVSMLRKLVSDRELRLMFIGIVIIGANAGGAWSPIGDVTTTMLWIGGQITSVNIMKALFLPSMLCLVVPLLILTFRTKKQVVSVDGAMEKINRPSSSEQKLILALGIGVLMFVPVFKTVTHLPPVMGILFGLSVLWIVTEILHKDKNDADKDALSVVHALRKADVPSVLFFLGILIAIAALESTHQLADLAKYLDHTIGNLNVIVISIGLFSAIIDNVPLVAASMGMYDLQTFPPDHYFWEFVAYCAGTGGSCLIIGSAAGVAAMGMEKIDFFWYLKKISLLALMGYLAGAVWYMVQSNLFD
jgi:Na+/H+ antiporter NhaD/arsenite permease-like protein